MTRNLLFVSLAAVWLCASVGNAQVSGRLSGTVVDQTSAAIPGPSVGVYMPGVKVSPLQESGVGNIKLEVQSTATTMDVTADVQSVQLSNAEISTTITASQVQNLPVLGRQVSNLLLTQAGVSPTSDTTSINGL